MQQSEKEILALNAFDRHADTALAPEDRQAVGRRLRNFGANAVLFYQEPIRMVRAEQVWMIDAAGRRYLDLYNNVPSVGHCHPRVVEAASRQMATLNINTRYLSDIVDAYAERLLATFPDPISQLALTCTGSEANDLALRIAQAATGGTGVVVTNAAYHGNTAAVTAVSPSSRPGAPLASHVRAVPAPETYRDPDHDLGSRFAAAIEAAIDDLARNGIRFSAFLADSIFSSDGVYADPPGFLAGAAEVVRRRGGLFIADEVQPGFGRTGMTLWSFGRHGVVPDIVTMGKPMGNGFPVGGLATRPDLLASLLNDVKYFNTFGGSPVAAAAGMAVLDVIEDEALMANACNVGDYMLGGLRALADRHAAIGDVRGAGLFIGLELVRDRVSKEPAPELAAAVVNSLREHSILIGAAGAYGNVLKIRPPLCFSREHADMMLTALDAVLSARSI